MLTGQRPALCVGLVAFALIGVVGCTGGTGRPRPMGTSTPTSQSAVSAPSPCTRVEIKAGIGRFFDAWNMHDPAAVARLCTIDGVLDMATKHQDTLTGQGWVSAEGRRMIAAFAERQWRRGETLSYRSVTIVFSRGALEGGLVNGVVARFADGAVQPMDEAKLAYDCTDHAFHHVVITSAKAAAA